MRKGRWTAATRAKHAMSKPTCPRTDVEGLTAKQKEHRAKAEAIKLGLEGRDAAHQTKHWEDRRVRQRAKARTKHETMLAQILWHRAHENRQDAIARGAPHYIGKPCKKHDNAERVTSCGTCIICVREAAERHRGGPVRAPRLDRKLRPCLSTRRLLPESYSSGKQKVVVKPVIELDADFD